MDLKRLNEPQREAVLHGDSPLLVLAGAGTGKTTAVTFRIAHMIQERGVRPNGILAVTFTNKAAREMALRVGEMTGLSPRGLDIGTFHGMCGRLLRQYGESLGLASSFVIYDAADQLALIRRCMGELKIDVQAFPPRAIRARIEEWKNQGLRANEVEPSAFDMTSRKALDVYELYRKRCLESNAVDFGDMLLHTLTLLRKNPEVREQCHRRWSHILVDEYQDTNPVQYKLLKQLATLDHSLTVVGDDDQSIYRWRGADIGNILRFERDFPGARVIRLEQNYRSTQTILDAANTVIAHNASRKGKTLFTTAGEGAKIRFRLYPTERDEADAIADEIARAVLGDSGEAVEPRQLALLYRTNAQSRPFEDSFRRLRIPYKIYGGVRFYDRKEVKDAIGYLRLLVNPRSDVDFMRIVNVPARGIGKTTLDNLQTIAQAEEVSFYEAAQLIAESGKGLSARPQKALNAFVQSFEACRKALDSDHPGRVLEELLETTGYLKFLRLQGTEESTERVENLAELVSAMDEYVSGAEDASITGFLEEIALAADVDAMAEEASDMGEVSLMTLHSAKGLEFPTVYIPGMEEGIFPHSRSLDDPGALEEERRLCYVGLTRGEERVFLSGARMRTVFGQSRWSEISRFISEIPDELLDFGTPASTAASSAVQAPDYPEFDDLEVYSTELSEPPSGGGLSSYSPGTRITHATFGEGQVVSSDGVGRGEKLTVQFPGVGRKVIVARFVERA